MKPLLVSLLALILIASPVTAARGVSHENTSLACFSSECFSAQFAGGGWAKLGKMIAEWLLGSVKFLNMLMEARSSSNIPIWFFLKVFVAALGFALSVMTIVYSIQHPARGSDSGVGKQRLSATGLSANESLFSKEKCSPTEPCRTPPDQGLLTTTLDDNAGDVLAGYISQLILLVVLGAIVFVGILVATG